MLSFFRSIFTKSTDFPATTIVRSAEGILYENGVEVPQSPPFARGIPVISRTALLESQKELIDKIYGTLSFSRSDFDKLALPLIERYAGWVHLLPASEAHHHKTAGGLFRHGLEVAFNAAQGSRGCIFGTGSTPSERRNNEARWRLAAMCVGLLHDIGKPLTDVIITDRTGEIRWHPHLSMINEWAAENKVDRYFLKWTDKRHKLHESFSAPMLGNIMTPEVMHYFYEGGSEIYASLADAICGLSAVKPLAKLMIEADQGSVAADLRENRISATDQDYGLPVERYIFDAIRSLVNSGQWTTNTVGSRVWNFQGHGVFIALRQGAAELYEATQKTHVPGIPKEADTIADILIDRGHAIPQPIEGTHSSDRYWQFNTSVSTEDGQTANVSLVLLKLDSPSLIFSTEPPAPIIGELEIAYDRAPAAKKLAVKKAVTKKPTAKKSESLDTAAAEQQIIDEQSPTTKSPLDFETLMKALKSTSPEADEDEPLEPETNDDAEPSDSEPGNATNDLKTEVKSTPDAQPEAEEQATEDIQPQQNSTVAQDDSTTTSSSTPTTATPRNAPVEQSSATADVQSKPASDVSAVDTLNEILAAYDDEVQKVLGLLVGAVLARDIPLGVTLSRIVGHSHLIGVPHPTGLKEVLPDSPVSETLKLLAGAGVIIPDPVFPTKNVHTIQSDKYLIFNSALEKAIVNALDEIENDASEPVISDLFGEIPAKKAAKKKTKKNMASIETNTSDQAAELKESSPLAPKSVLAPEANSNDTEEKSKPQEPVQADEAIPDDLYDETYYRNIDDEFDGEGDVLDTEPCEIQLAETQKKIDDEEYKNALIDAALLATRVTGGDVAEEFKKQIQAGSGPWIISDVVTTPAGLEISADCLKVASAKYAGLVSEHEIKKALLSQGWVVGRRSLILKVSKTNGI